MWCVWYYKPITRTPYEQQCSENSSFANIAAVLNPTSGQTTHVLPVERFAPEEFKYPAGIQSSFSWVGCVHNDSKDFGSVWFHYFTRLLEDGRLKAHPFEEKAGGLEGVGEALKDLKAGKASALKYVFDVSKTPGL